MKKLLLIVVALSLAMFGLAGCTTAETGGHDHGPGHETMDEAIHELEAHFAAFYLLGSDASLADVQALLADVDTSWDELTASAQDDPDHDITAASIAHDALSGAAAGLTEEAPMPAIEPFLGAFKDEIETLHETGDFH